MVMFMKLLNNISRSQAVFRRSNISAEDLQSPHYAYLLAVFADPGLSQEEIAEKLCVNKSTVARNLNYLEEKGYIVRTASPEDRRQLSVHPTEKLLCVIPKIRAVSAQWMKLLSEGIAPEELNVFNSVLMRMEAKARTIIDSQEENK